MYDLKKKLGQTNANISELGMHLESITIAAGTQEQQIDEIDKKIRATAKSKGKGSQIASSTKRR